ncbi:MAG: NnrU family protein [Limnohabitans sp.]
MLTLLFGLILFIGVHCLQALAPDWRSRQRERWGELAYKGLYSLVAGAGLVLMVVGYGQARSEPVPLWTPPRALVHASFLLMWVAMVLLVAAYVPRNAIRRRLGHPMTLGVKTWALGHLLANGTLADLMLFGTFLIWSVLVFRSARRRPAPASVTAPVSALGTVLTLLLGSGVWAAFLWGGLHARWIGIDPLGGMGA